MKKFAILTFVIVLSLSAYADGVIKLRLGGSDATLFGGREDVELEWDLFGGREDVELEWDLFGGREDVELEWDLFGGREDVELEWDQSPFGGREDVELEWDIIVLDQYGNKLDAEVTFDENNNMIIHYHGERGENGVIVKIFNRKTKSYKTIKVKTI